MYSLSSSYHRMLRLTMSSSFPPRLSFGRKRFFEMFRRIETAAFSSSQIRAAVASQVACVLPTTVLRGRDHVTAAATAASPLSDATAAPPTSDPSAVVARPAVINVFNNRPLSATSRLYQSLTQIGLTPTADGLDITDPAALKRFALDHRSGKAKLPDHWTQRMRSTLGRVIANPQFTNPVEAVRSAIDLMKTTRANAAKLRVGVIGEANAEEDVIDLNMSLNNDQKWAIELAKRGFHIYLGGQAGTGKTVVVRRIKKALTDLGVKVAVTASTGLAACHINGLTFHHAFGVDPTLTDFFRDRNDELTMCGAIIIDEVSMLQPELIIRLDQLLRSLRCSPTTPFGGCQMIFTGDFLQLSSIPSKGRPRFPPLFEWEVFQQSVVKFKLSEQVRQSADVSFASALGDLRVGKADSFEHLVAHVPEGTPLPTTGATLLLARNEDVIAANRERLSKLPGASVNFEINSIPPVVHGSWTNVAYIKFASKSIVEKRPQFVTQAVEKYLASVPNCPRVCVTCYESFDDLLALRFLVPDHHEATAKIITQHFNIVVGKLPSILQTNHVTVVNVGSVANECCPFESEVQLEKQARTHPWAQSLELKEGCDVMLRTNLSARLVNGSVGRVVGFEAMAKVEELKFGYRMTDLHRRAFEEYYQYQRFVCGVDLPRLPIVRFPTEEVAIAPTRASIGGCHLSHYFKMPVIALPLSLAYAFTVHKVQGLTLRNDVRVDLSKMWKCPHLIYVAASRAQKASQLSFVNYKRELVQVDTKAVDFDASLQTASQVHHTCAAMPVASWVTSASVSRSSAARKRGAQQSVSTAGLALVDPAARPAKIPVTAAENVSTASEAKTPLKAGTERVPVTTSKNRGATSAATAINVPRLFSKP